MATVIYASSLTFLVTVAMVILLYLVLVRMFKRRRFKPHDWWMAGQGSEHGDDDVMNDRASTLSLLKPFFHMADDDEVFHIGGTPRSGTTSSSEEDSLMKSLNEKNKKMTAHAQTRKESCGRGTKEQQNSRESRTERWVESVSHLSQDRNTQS
ncbi:Hypp5332 [Branchiostoma lanceolatum]|uniref:Hypp5332 protein n=1 Tax=Branchiostoma lanceolatum TaxID=7740 RepID=A0A8K0AEK5_BRALA|nr:Hypp5332 [Branchiostoma lanceolatum]